MFFKSIQHFLRTYLSFLNSTLTAFYIELASFIGNFHTIRQSLILKSFNLLSDREQ